MKMTLALLGLGLVGCQKDDEVGVLSDPNVSYYQLYTSDYDNRSMTSLSEIRNNPMTWRSHEVRGHVRVQDTPTDRGFWLESSLGDRLFALLIDEPRDAYKDIDPHQDLYLMRAVVRTPDDLDSVPGEPLSDESRRIAKSQPAFLVVDEDDLVILGQRRDPAASRRAGRRGGWDRLDTDQDDRISRSEFDESMRGAGYRRYDADGNDELDDAEWRERTFVLWDRDGDGALSRNEIRRAQRDWSNYPDVEWPAYDDWDTDSDGQLGSEEFAAWDGTATVYATYDANGDGIVTRDEYSARTWSMWDADGDGYVTVVEYPYAY